MKKNNKHTNQRNYAAGEKHEEEETSFIHYKKLKTAHSVLPLLDEKQRHDNKNNPNSPSSGSSTKTATIKQQPSRSSTSNHLSRNPALASLLDANIIVNTDRQMMKQIQYNSLNSYDYRRRFQFYQKYLRLSFIVLTSIAFVLSFLTFMPMAQLFKNFNYRCPLYATISYKFAYAAPTTRDISTNNTMTPTSNVISTMLIDESLTKWGSQDICNYCISVGILIVCYSVLSLFFFIMFNMKDLVKNDFCLLIPWITLTSVFTLMQFICSIFLTHGFLILCSGLYESDTNQLTNSAASFKSKTIIDAAPLIKNCRKAQSIVWKNLNNENAQTADYLDNGSFYDYLLISMISSWLLLIVMLFMDLDVVVRIVFIYQNYNYETKLNKKLYRLVISNSASSTNTTNLHKKQHHRRIKNSEQQLL